MSWDLYSLKKIVILNYYFKFSKHLTLSFIDKFTTRTQSLVLFIFNVAWTKFSSSSNNIQVFTHTKSSFTSRLIKIKSRDLQKLGRYLGRIVIFVLKGYTRDRGSCGGWDSFTFGGGCAGCGGLTSIFLLFSSYN